MWWVEIVWDQYTLPETNIAPETTGVGSDEFPFGKASLYRCELLVSESIFWWFLSLRRVMYRINLHGVFLVLGSFLLSHQGGGGGNFPNFLQMVLRWQPTGGQRKLTSTNQSIPGCPIKLHGPQIKAGKVVVFLVHGTLSSLMDLNKTISDFEAPLGTLVMGL